VGKNSSGNGCKHARQLWLTQVSLLTPVDFFTARFRALDTFMGEPLGIEMVETETLASFYAASRSACSRSMAASSQAASVPPLPGSVPLPRVPF
jgi:hypothetical protein